MMTFDEAVDGYLKRHVAKLRTADQVEGIFKLPVFEPWRSRRLSAIAGKDVADILDVVEMNAGPARVNRVLAAVRGLFNFAMSRGWIDASPIRPGLVRKEDSRDRVLSFDEVGAIWRSLGDIGGPYAGAARMLFLTGQRATPVSQMRRSAIDRRAMLWRTTSADQKNGVAMNVPLSPVALRVIADRPVTEGLDFVFSSDGAQGVTAWSWFKDRVDVASGVENWRWHDVRRTVATIMGGLLGFDPDTVQAVLGHSGRARIGVTAIYDRSDREDSMRLALNAVARLLELVADLDGWAVVDDHLHSVRPGEDANGPRERRAAFRHAIRGSDSCWGQWLSSVTGAANGPIQEPYLHKSTLTASISI
ncbi:MAG: tyrosine-type recombinase/integrase [Alphaproteobacteria bacterium]|nr:tyrosine-type recombinase/integrase [Alphaproteobacteria bacterium]